MLTWVFLFQVAAFIAALFGFTKVPAASAGVAKIIFFFCAVLFAASLVIHIMQ